MLAEMKALAIEKNICVLATVGGRKPHCSLMAYVTDENCTEIYMVTHKNTNKYKNLMENPSVSLLIDTREISPRTKALSIVSTFLFSIFAVKKRSITVAYTVLTSRFGMANW